MFASGYIEDYCGLLKSQPYSKYFLLRINTTATLAIDVEVSSSEQMLYSAWSYMISTSTTEF